MGCYDSIGAMIKWYIKCRNKSIAETAAAMNIKNTTFSMQLIHNTVSADTLLKLAAYLDIDLEWMMIVLGYHGTVSAVEREMIPRMRNEFREKELERVNKVLDIIIMENPESTPDARRELLKAYSGNVFYLIDVLIPEEYGIYMYTERDTQKYFVDIPMPPIGRQSSIMKRKRINRLYEGSKALDIVIEERKDLL